jgi:hypothetical protein
METRPARRRNKELEGQIVGKKFISIDQEIGIRKIASNKVRDIWP